MADKTVRIWNRKGSDGTDVLYKENPDGTFSQSVFVQNSPDESGEGTGLTDTQLRATPVPVSDAVLGATNGAAVVTDANGTIQQYLRGLIALMADPAAVSVLPAASELHLGEVSGKNSFVSTEFTRENNATPYGIGDVISGSAGSPVLYELPNIMRINGGSGYVWSARITFNVKSVVPLLRLHFFNVSNPVISGDNLPHQEKYVDISKRLGYIDFPAMTTAADTTNSDMSRTLLTGGAFLPVFSAPSSRSLWVLVETLTAVTLTAQSKVTVSVAVSND